MGEVWCIHFQNDWLYWKSTDYILLLSHFAPSYLAALLSSVQCSWDFGISVSCFVGKTNLNICKILTMASSVAPVKQCRWIFWLWCKYWWAMFKVSNCRSWQWITIGLLLCEAISISAFLIIQIDTLHLNFFVQSTPPTATTESRFMKSTSHLLQACAGCRPTVPYTKSCDKIVESWLYGGSIKLVIMNPRLGGKMLLSKVTPFFDQLINVTMWVTIKALGSF